MSYSLETTEFYDNWFSEQEKRVQAQIEIRLSRITKDEHFGDIKRLEKDLFELRFIKSGIRIYFTKHESNPKKTVILLLGGSKHAQQKDIKKAKKLLSG